MGFPCNALDAFERPGYLRSDRLSLLDLYVAVVFRWRPRRLSGCREAPCMAEVVRRVDASPGRWITGRPDIPSCRLGKRRPESHRSAALWRPLLSGVGREVWHMLDNRLRVACRCVRPPVQVCQPFVGARLASAFVPGEGLDDSNEIGPAIHENDFHSSCCRPTSANANDCDGA